jgi:hypothetical protein
MSKSEDIERAEKVLKELTERLQSCNVNLTRIINDIAMFEVLKKMLVENIQVLKSEDIISVASEFKKAQDELERTKDKLLVLNLSLITHKRTIAEIQKNVIENKDKLANLTPPGTLITGDFGNNGNK